LRAPHQPRPVSKKRANKPARTAGKRRVQKIKESRSNLNIYTSARFALMPRRPQPVKIRTPTCENPIARQAGGGPIFTAWGLRPAEAKMFRGLPRLKTKFEAKNDCTNAHGGTTASETPTGRDEIVVLRCV